MEILWHSEIGSTNEEARTLARMGATHGTILGADYQTSGRGRSGREWLCEKGDGLMCSVILRPTWPKSYWAWIALLGGLVIAEQLERDCLYPKIKWPNDILVNGKKIAGILTEAGNDWVVIGIGMNLNMKTVPEVQDGLQPTSFYLETDCELDTRSLAERFRNSLLLLLEMERPTLLIEEIEKRLAWRDEPVQFTYKKRLETGRLLGVGEYGELRVVNEHGKERALVDAGSIRPVKTS